MLWKKLAAEIDQLDFAGAEIVDVNNLIFLHLPISLKKGLSWQQRKAFYSLNTHILRHNVFFLRKWKSHPKRISTRERPNLWHRCSPKVVIVMTIYSFIIHWFFILLWSADLVPFELLSTTLTLLSHSYERHSKSSPFWCQVPSNPTKSLL